MLTVLVMTVLVMTGAAAVAFGLVVALMYMLATYEF